MNFLEKKTVLKLVFCFSFKFLALATAFARFALVKKFDKTVKRGGNVQKMLKI